MPVVNTNVQVFVQALFRKHERTGRLLGVDSFIAPMEFLLGRKLKPKKPGPKNKDKQGIFRISEKRVFSKKY